LDAMPESLDVAFSAWTPWAERESLSGVDQPGVYILAHFTSPPIGRADPLSREVIYIGETCDSSLRKRWYRFNRSAFEGKFGHSGGKTYRAICRDRSQDLFVAAFPVQTVDTKLRPLFIRYVERKLIWEYAQRWKIAPMCNRK
jgi:hypothetical protein